MEIARLPDNEKGRLAALESYDILDTMQEESFDEIVTLASQICETPISLISLIDGERQWFKAKRGLEADSTSREVAFCAHAILDKDELFIVNNADKDERFGDNPLVASDPKIRFYAGAPLVDADGYPLGTLCVIDEQPRELNDFQKEALASLSRQAMRLISARKKSKELQEISEKLAEREEQLSQSNAELEAINELNVRLLKAQALSDILRLIGESVGTHCHAKLAVYLESNGNYDLWWNNLDRNAKDLESFEPAPSSSASEIVLPIISEEKTIGFFRGIKPGKEKFSEEEFDFFELLTSISSTKIRNAMYREEIGKSEKKLETVKEGSDQILELALDAVITIGSDGMVQGWNPRAEELFGFSKSEAIGKRLSELIIPTQHREGHERGMDHYNKTGEGPVLGNRIEITAINREGHEFPVELTVIPVRGDNEMTFTAFVRDISVRIKAEEELKEALERQKKLAEMKSKFVSMTSHEFRTPLTSISSNVELLQYYLKDEPEEKRGKLQKNFNRILGEIGRLTNLMNDILLLGRLESGKIPFKPGLIDVEALCRSLVHDRFSRMDDGRSVEFSVYGKPKEYWIDENIYTHVISNILSNAFKYSKGKDNPQMKLNFNKESFTIEVTDYGMGIPLEEQEGIFETFTRGTNVENIQGTGLGLPIVRQFTQMHKGDVYFISNPGVETKFIVTQPYIEHNEEDSGH